MKKKHMSSSIILMFLLVFFLTSCDDITRNLNIFSWLHQDKTTEEQLEKAAYYMEKGNKSNYQNAYEIYEEILITEPDNSDAVYGYATAFARKTEIEEEVVGAMVSIMGLMADLKSTTIVTLFARLYTDENVAKDKQLATYDIAEKVSSVLDGLANDVDNTKYKGKVKSQDVWLDAAIAYIHLSHSTISTNSGDAEEASVLELEWDPETKSIRLSVDTSSIFASLINKANLIKDSKDALTKAFDIIELHTSAELSGLTDTLDEVEGFLTDFLTGLESE